MRANGWVEQDRRAFKAVVRLSDGSRRSKNFSVAKFGAREAKRAADNWQHELVLAIERGTSTDPRAERITYAKWIVHFKASEAVSLRASTLAQHDHLFKNHVLPAFGRKSLGSITPQMIQHFVNELSASGLAPSTVLLCYQMLSKSLDAAVQAQMLGRSPCSRSIMLPERVHTEMRFLTPVEVAQLADAIEAPYRSLVMLAAYSGLRIGELAALKRECVDLKSNCVEVRETVLQVGGHLSFGPPKTKRSYRRVPIPQQVSDLLVDHLKGDRDGFVFQAHRGGVLRPNLWRNRSFNPAAVRAGLRTADMPLTPHALRHTAVSIWIEAGVSPAEIAQRAGHASAAFVLDNYGHLLPHGDAAFSDRVGRLYVPPT